MPIRNSFKYQDIANVLEYFNCHISRQGKGSHEERYSPRTNTDFPVPRHGSKELKVGTLFAILKQAGISKDEVLNFLGKKNAK